MSEENQNNEWLPIIGRLLALLCINSADLKDKGMADQAKFLKTVGMSNADIATLLGTSVGSIRGLLSYADKSKSKKSQQSKQKDQ